MPTLLNRNALIVLLAVLLAVFVVFLVVRVITGDSPDWVTSTVERGTVREVVSVSGYIEAKNTAELAFPATGRVTEVFVHEGQKITAGEVLATQASVELVAKRNEATAGLRVAEAKYEQLLGGESIAVKNTADTSLQNAKQALERTIREEAEKVKSARKTLLSDGLIARTTDLDEDAPAPTVSGTYTCTQEGTYTITVYNSGSFSGYSYRMSGLETGTAQAGVEQPGALGTCGLFLQFEQDQNYNNSVWEITIPNKTGINYITYNNAYTLALESEKVAVEKAKDALALAQNQYAEVYEDPRSEEIRSAAGAIDQARAQIAAIDAQIGDRSITAPFDGTVTEVSILPGETSPTTPIITVLATDAFELKARIPEIDITKIKEEQAVVVVFDAESEATYDGKIAYVSPLAKTIDGVAYFEATITLTTLPSWIKSGLNADVDIIIEQKDDVLRIPKRFIFETNKVYVPNKNEKEIRTLDIVTTGNDGYVEIRGLDAGETVIAP